MVTPNIVRYLLLTLSLFSLFFLPKKSFREYLPTSIFTSILVMSMCALAVPYKWWVVKGGWKNKIINDLSLILGPFFAGTMWIFHYTFGNFKRYTLINLIMDFLFSYPLNYLFQSLNLYKLVNFKPKHIFMLFTCFAFTIYGYQSIIKRVR